MSATRAKPAAADEAPATVAQTTPTAVMENEYYLLCSYYTYHFRYVLKAIDIDKAIEKFKLLYPHRVGNVYSVISKLEYERIVYENSSSEDLAHTFRGRGSRKKDF